MTNKKNGKVVNTMSQVQVRPVVLYEIVFPKEQLDAVLTTLFKKTDGKTAHKKFQFVVNMIKKGLGLKTIPKEWDRSKHLLIGGMEGVEAIAIGLKEDRTNEFLRTAKQLKQVGLDPKGDWECEAL